MESNKESKVNITLPESFKGNSIEVVMREGKAANALDPTYPEKIAITGTIEAPFNWLEKRISLIEQKSANIIVCRDDITIVLTVDEKSAYKDVITGQLERSALVGRFGINTNHLWEPANLAQFLKMNRAYFPNKKVNMEVVSCLANFNATVNQQVDKNVDKAGSYSDNFSQIVNSNLPESFKINIPLFAGMSYETIDVEIYATVSGREVVLMLVSPGAEELVEAYRNKVIDEQLAQIRKIAPDIVIIEE